MSNKIIKSTAVILGCSVMAKILSFIWEAILAAYLGVSDQADAIHMTTSIFNILYPVLDTGIWKVFLPIYQTKLVQDTNEEAHKFANIALTFFTCLSIAFMLFLIFFAQPITMLFAPGFSAEKKAMTAQFLMWSAPRYLFMASASVVGAMLQCHGRFLGSQMREIGTHLSRIICVVLCYRYLGIYAAILAFVIGGVFRLLMQLPFINWQWQFRPNTYFRNADMQQMFKRLPAVAASSAISHINGLVDKIIASGTVSGAVSCLNYGHKLMNVFSGMISTAIGTATYPTMVQHIAAKQTDKLRELLTNTIQVLSFIIIPVSFFCILFSRELVTVAFQRGAFDASATQLTAAIFAAYSTEMLFTGIAPTISNVFFGHGDSRTSLYLSILSISLNIIFNFWFCRLWGVVGLAIATSLSAAICFFVRLILLRKYLTLDYKSIVKELVKILLISSIAIGGAFALLACFGIANVFARVLCGMLCSVAVYLILAKLFRISTMVLAISMIRKKLNRR